MLKKIKILAGFSKIDSSYKKFLIDFCDKNGYSLLHDPIFNKGLILF